MTDLTGIAAVEPPLEPPAGVDSGDGWKVNRRTGAEFIPAIGRSGVIHRRGDETPEEARRRDQAERPPASGPAGGTAAGAPEQDKRPRPKSKRPPMPEAPRKIELKELERTLAEALKAPAMLCATFGDEWAAEHFTTSGPYLARNLILASEHNPWLRRKLEEAATGQDAAMKVISLVGVGGAAVAYAVPPIIWWLNLPVSERTRQMFGIPPDRKRKAAYAARQNGQPPSPEVAAQPEPAPQPEPAAGAEAGWAAAAAADPAGADPFQ